MSFFQRNIIRYAAIANILLSPIFCADVPLGDQLYDSTLKSVKAALDGRKVSCFISYAWDGDTGPYKQFAHVLQGDLEKAGIRAMIDIDYLPTGESITKFIQTIGHSNFFVIPIFTESYKERAEIPGSWLSREVALIYERLRIYNDSTFYVPVLLNGEPQTSIPLSLLNVQETHTEPDDLYVDFRNQAQQIGSEDYKKNFLRLLIEKLLKPINSQQINEVSRKIMAFHLLQTPNPMAYAS